MRKLLPHLMSRRDVLVGAGAALTASGAVAESAPTRQTLQFDVQSFVEECRRANQEAAADRQAAIEEVVRRAMSEPRSVLAAVGEPQKGGIRTLYRAEPLVARAAVKVLHDIPDHALCVAKEH